MYDKSGQLSVQAKRLIILLAAILVIVLIGYLGWHAYNNIAFKVNYTDPKLSEMTDWNPQIDIYFNKNLSSKGLSVITFPNNILYGNNGSSYLISGNRLRIFLDAPVKGGISYTININNIEATNGQTLNNLKFVYYAKPISSTQITDEDVVEALRARVKPNNDPILAHLPYNNLYFNLTDTVTTNANASQSFVLNAQLFLNQSQMADEQASISQDKQMVQQYISSLGLNPSNYTINYTVETP